MPYTLEHSEKGEYLISRHQGDVNASELRAARQDAINLRAETGAKRLLIDFRQASSIPGIGDSYFIAQEAAASSSKATRTAVVARSEHYEIAQFAAFAAKTAGLIVRTFEDEVEALRWLLA
jgi:anti-anti-sigma regulatory factor